MARTHASNRQIGLARAARRVLRASAAILAAAAAAAAGSIAQAREKPQPCKTPQPQHIRAHSRLAAALKRLREY